ncbi:MAG: hypothetical protein K0S36_2097 [Nitrosospira multiformis]|jgi:hypothetical protein|nr:hypothetical protein [Nitrosospira multiformis]
MISQANTSKLSQRERELLADPFALQTLGFFGFNVGVLEEYKKAKRKSSEAAQAFLAHREELHKREKENPRPIKTAHPPKSDIPAFPPNEITRLMQQIAQRGILLELNEQGKLAATGRKYLIEKQLRVIVQNRRAIRQTLLEIKASHGTSDPLGLEALVDEHNFYLNCARMEKLRERYAHDFDVIRKCADEEKAATVTAIISDGPPEESGSGSPGDSESSPSENGESRRYDLLTVEDLSKIPPSQYRVKNVLPHEGLSAIYGPPGAGKTFVALDLAFAISDGVDWFGYQAKPCDVLYICLEGQSGLPQRVQAYREHHGADCGKRLKFITTPFSLAYEDDVATLVATVNDAQISNGVIVIDTLSAASPGLDENSSADMGRILEAARRIRQECGGLVVVVHHSGKDASKGLRGHSSLPAALDTVIQVKRNDDRRTWELAKAKDGVEGEEHPFRLSIIELGKDEDGDPITSCVVLQEEVAAGSATHFGHPKGANQRIVYEVAGELLRKSKHFGEGGAPTSHPCIRPDDLIEACHGRLAVPEDRWRERVRSALNGLISKGCLVLRENWVWNR